MRLDQRFPPAWYAYIQAIPQLSVLTQDHLASGQKRKPERFFICSDQLLEIKRVPEP
jgi:hypothetical protein